MDSLEVLYNREGEIMLLIDDEEIVISRVEAEKLFVELGHTLATLDDEARMNSEGA